MDTDTQRRSMQDLAVRWTRAQPAVAAFIGSVVPGHHDAEDVLQRTAAALVTSFHKYDPAQPFTAWAIGVARVEVLRHRQTRQRDRLVFDDEAVSAVASAYESGEAELNEMRRVLDACIAKLRGRGRQILELHHLRGLSPAAIAEEVGASANAVFIALHRARASIRRCIERQIGMNGGAA